MAFFPNKNDARERERRISSCLSRKISELGDLGSLKKLQLFCGLPLRRMAVMPGAMGWVGTVAQSGGFEHGDNDR